MRRGWYTAAAGLALAPLLGLGVLRGAEPPRETKPVPPASNPITDPVEKSCGSYGTKIDFLESPAEAAKLAKKENKLVFILHVSGLFEDPKLT
jgi:hypothetical protein